MAGEEGSPQGSLPRLQLWPPTNAKQRLSGSKEEGQVEEERVGWGGKRKGESGGKKGREKRVKEQMERKEGGKE